MYLSLLNFTRKNTKGILLGKILKELFGWFYLHYVGFIDQFRWILYYFLRLHITCENMVVKVDEIKEAIMSATGNPVTYSAGSSAALGILASFK